MPEWNGATSDDLDARVIVHIDPGNRFIWFDVPRRNPNIVAAFVNKKFVHELPLRYEVLSMWYYHLKSIIEHAFDMSNRLELFSYLENIHVGNRCRRVGARKRMFKKATKVFVRYWLRD